MATFAQVPDNSDSSDDEMPSIDDCHIDESAFGQDPEENPSEDDMTPEDRLKYLRDHGIEVSEPGQAQKALYNPSPPPPGSRKCAYIMIPSNPSLPPRTLYTFIPPENVSRKASGSRNVSDPLLEELRGKFNISGSSTFKSRYTPAEIMKQTREASGGGGHVNLTTDESGTPKATMVDMPSDETINSMIEAADISGGSPVETFPLSTAGPTNGFETVNIYIDEVSTLKSYPLNKRACDLAEKCGFTGVKLHGDCYVARRIINPTTNRRELIDMSVEEGEIHGDAKWIREAFRDNHEYQASLDKDGAVSGAFGKDVTEVLGGGGRAVATGEGYVWTQDEDEIEIVVVKPDSLKGDIDKRKVKTKYTNDSVQLHYDGEEWLNVKGFFEPIDKDGCTWQLASNKAGVVITLEKENSGVSWTRLLR